MVLLGLLEVNAYPNQSPLEGGGELALLFGGQLPPGPKWLSFISQARPEYVHQVEAIENNTVALTAVIPKHEIPETLNLQVVCGGRIIAHTEFTYFANAQYHCDQFFQYLNQMFPSYFPDVAGGGPMGGPLGGADETGLGGGSYGYFGNIPSSSYSLLLGACRLGIEPLIYATLQLPSMSAITPTQLSKAKELAEENGHVNAGKVLDILSGIAELTISKGSEVEPSESFIESKTGKEALAKLDYIKDDYKGGGIKILDYLAKIHKMEHRDRVEKERGSDTSGASSQIASPTVHPASPIHQPPTSADGRRQGSIKLKRQDESVREEDEPPQSDGGDELTPPTHIHSRASISEQEDQLLPLMPMRSLKGAGRAGAFGQKRLVASYSDAADSAVSMSFDHDRDFDQELLRRGSASLVSSGLYSLNSTSKEHLNITIHAQEGETFANSLQYECVYQVTEDFPPNSDSSNVILKMGDRIIQIGDQSVRGKAPEEFAEILQNEATRGTTIKILPQLSSMPSMHSLASSIGYGSLDVSERKQLARRQSDKDLTSSLTAKVSNLLTMKASNHTRSLTLPRNTGEGWGFDITGGNAVGLFVSKVNSGRKELQVGDQILELGGHNTSGMSHHEAMAILHSARDKVQLKVIENHAKFSIVKDLIELESYYIQCGIDHTPSDVRDMPLMKDRVFRVVNTVLFAGYWLAWSVDPNTGLDRELRRIPSPSKAKQQHGKEVYESIIEPVITAN